MNSCIVKPGLRLTGGCLSLGLLILMAGCNNIRKGEEQAEVSGRVLFQGKPLPGGRVSFVAVNGGVGASETIDESGNYKIKAPIGDVKIGVDNSMLEPKRFGGGPPKSMKHPKPPNSSSDAKSVKGQYVRIPREYKDPSTSGLSYTVQKGAQTHDIELSNNPAGAK